MSTIPPEIPEYKTLYEAGFVITSPFLDVVDNLIVPKGCVAAYRDSNWGQSFKNITESSSL